MNARKMAVTTLCNLISEVTSHRICHILFIKSDTLGPAHTEAKQGDYIWCGYKKTGIMGTSTSSPLPQGDVRLVCGIPLQSTVRSLLMKMLCRWSMKQLLRVF